MQKVPRCTWYSKPDPSLVVWQTYPTINPHGVILIYSRANGIKAKFLICLACGFKICVCKSLWTLLSENLLIPLLIFFCAFFPLPHNNSAACHFLLNGENDLVYSDGLWNNSTHCIALILHPGAVSHYGYERQNIESLTVKNLRCERWSLSRTLLLVIITLLCTAIGPWSQVGAEALVTKCSANTFIIP